RLRELLAERNQPDRGVERRAARDGAMFIDAPLLNTALGLLSNDEQNAVRLIVCEGKSYQHAAESLGVTVATVNNWKHRGLVKMRRILAEAETSANAAPVPQRGQRRWGRNDRAHEAHHQHWATASDEVA